MFIQVSGFLRDLQAFYPRCISALYALYKGSRKVLQPFHKASKIEAFRPTVWDARVGV